MLLLLAAQCRAVGCHALNLEVGRGRVAKGLDDGRLLVQLPIKAHRRAKVAKARSRRGMPSEAKTCTSRGRGFVEVVMACMALEHFQALGTLCRQTRTTCGKGMEEAVEIEIREVVGHVDPKPFLGAGAAADPEEVHDDEAPTESAHPRVLHVLLIGH